MNTEERLAVVETKLEERTDDITRILKEVRDDVKTVCKNHTDMDKRVASLEQSRATARKATGVLGVPILGTVLHTVLKAIGLY